MEAVLPCINRQCIEIWMYSKAPKFQLHCMFVTFQLINYIPCSQTCMFSDVFYSRTMTRTLLNCEVVNLCVIIVTSLTSMVDKDHYLDSEKTASLVFHGFVLCDPSL